MVRGRPPTPVRTWTGVRVGATCSLCDSEEATVANQVLVKRVTVEYECQGKAFTVVFNDPTKIDSIILGTNDRRRLELKQDELSKKNPPEAPKVVRNIFDPSNPAKDIPTDTLAITVSSPTPVDPKLGIEARSLWWHSSECQWFHPEGDQ